MPEAKLFLHGFCPKITTDLAVGDTSLRRILSFLYLLPQEVATFSEASAPAPRERHEPLFRLLRPDNHLIQLCCLSGREIVPERGWWLAEGGVFPKGSNLGEDQASTSSIMP
jgi:hypothetical protein